jgi:hypothetical protein
MSFCLLHLVLKLLDLGFTVQLDNKLKLIVGFQNGVRETQTIFIQK